jgi:type IV pilus assembly protein PilC
MADISGENQNRRRTDAPEDRGVKDIEQKIEEVALDEDREAPKEDTFFQRAVFRGVREWDIIVFLRQLVMLLQSGTPLLRSLKTLARRTERPAMRSLIADIAAHVEAGNPLWQGFDRHRRYFGVVFVNLVKASEASGTLVDVLERLVRYRERRQRFTRRIQSALVYPVVVLIACIAVIFFIGAFVLPEFQKIFARLDAEVPDFTKGFIAFVDAIVSWWFVLIVILVVAALVLLYRWLASNRVRRMKIDRIKLMIPYVGPSILRKSAIVDMTRTMSLLLNSGLSMMATLDLTRNAIRNQAVANVIQDVRDSVEQGKGMEGPLRENEALIPPVVVDMLVTGEESGQLPRICGEIAERYEEEVDVHINTLAEMLPPALALLMGIFVLILALSVFVPLISMLDQLQQQG